MVSVLVLSQCPRVVSQYHSFVMVLGGGGATGST